MAPPTGSAGRPGRGRRRVHSRIAGFACTGSGQNEGFAVDASGIDWTSKVRGAEVTAVLRSDCGYARRTRSSGSGISFYAPWNPHSRCRRDSVSRRAAEDHRRALVSQPAMRPACESPKHLAAVDPSQGVLLDPRAPHAPRSWIFHSAACASEVIISLDSPFSIASYACRQSNRVDEEGSNPYV
jgi:hypothetical protein